MPFPKFRFRLPAAFGIAQIISLSFTLAAEPSSEPLGKWEISPDRLVSGTPTRIELRYANGSTQLPPNSYFLFDLEPMSVKALAHTPASTDFQIVSWHGPLPRVEIEKGTLEGVGYFSRMKLKFPDGLEPGASFAMLIGNRTPEGDVMGLVTPIPVHGLCFNMTAVLGDGGKKIDWYKSGWHSSLPRCDIEGGAASALRITAPTLVKTGSKFDLRIAVTVDFDSGCYPAFSGKIDLSAPKPVNDLPAELAFADADKSSKTIPSLSISQPGVYRIVGKLEGKRFESNPIVVRDKVKTPIYWGFLHSHNWYSELWGDGPRETYRFARDVSGMDFVGLSDHIGTAPNATSRLGRLLPYRLGKDRTSEEAWLDSMDAASEFDNPGTFTALLGYEFTDESCSHYVVYWAGLSKTTFSQMWPGFLPSFQSQLLEPLGAIDALVIPHVHATYVPYSEWNTGFTKSGYPLTPVFEANSDWGMAFPGFGITDPLLGGGATDIAVSFPKVISRGYKVGIVGDSDCHEGLPGRRIQAAAAPGHAISPQGLTAVPATSLAREGIIAGYRSRATYSTSGEHIFLELDANGSGMGSDVKTDVETALSVQVNGTDSIDRVNLWDGNGIVQTQKFENQRDLQFAFPIPAPQGAETPYFVEVIQKNHHRAWSSPIWIGKKSLPDLAWETDANHKVYLVNRGTVEARNIQVLASNTQSPFAIEAIAPATGNPKAPAAQIQLRRWSDQRVTIFYYYKGPKTTQTIQLKGYKSYQMEPNRGQWWHGTQRECGGGKIEFTNAGGRVACDDKLTQSEWRGIDITLEIDPGQPCSVQISHEMAFDTYIGTKVITGTTADLNLNTLDGASADQIRVIPQLAPHQRIEINPGFRLYSADPLNAILEICEDNNGLAHE